MNPSGKPALTKAHPPAKIPTAGKIKEGDHNLAGRQEWYAKRAGIGKAKK